MKTLLGKRLANSVSAFGSMVLFLIFACCSLVMIAVGASTYSRISDGFRSSFSSSAAVRYVTNKIRSGDRAVVENEGKGIAIYSGETVCVIMDDNGSIGERNVKAESYIDYYGGDIIFPDTTLTIGEENGLFVICARAGEEMCIAYCRSKG